MAVRSTLVVAVAALVLAAPLCAGGEGAKTAGKPVLLRLPASGSRADLDSLEHLGPERELLVRGLPGECIFVRLGLPTSGSATPQLSVVCESEGQAWLASTSFASVGAPVADDVEAVWLATAVPEDAEPGFNEGHLIARTNGHELRVPFIADVSSGQLGPTTTRYLVITDGSTSRLAGLPPCWPSELPVTFSAVEEPGGDVRPEVSGLEALLDGLPGDRQTAQPLPVFLGPHMDRVCERYGVERLSPTYVLALHDFLTQLRDRAKSTDTSLLFVPPASPIGDDPDGLALKQHVAILRETPGIRVLLPVKPLLDLKQSEQQRLLDLSQAYLINGAKGLDLVRKRGAEGAPVWLRAPASSRLLAGFWARSVHVQTVLLDGTDCPDAPFCAAVAETDARYFDSVAQGVADARTTGYPLAQRVADQTEDLLDDLTDDVEKVVAEGRTDVDAEAEAVSWRRTLRTQIDELARVREQP